MSIYNALLLLLFSCLYATPPSPIVLQRIFFSNRSRFYNIGTVSFTIIRIRYRHHRTNRDGGRVVAIRFRFGFDRFSEQILYWHSATILYNIMFLRFWLTRYFLSFSIAKTMIHILLLIFFFLDCLEYHRRWYVCYFISNISRKSQYFSPSEFQIQSLQTFRLRNSDCWVFYFLGKLQVSGFRIDFVNRSLFYFSQSFQRSILLGLLYFDCT